MERVTDQSNQMMIHEVEEDGRVRILIKLACPPRFPGLCDLLRVKMFQILESAYQHPGYQSLVMRTEYPNSFQCAR